MPHHPAAESAIGGRERGKFWQIFGLPFLRPPGEGLVATTARRRGRRASLALWRATITHSLTHSLRQPMTPNGEQSAAALHSGTHGHTQPRSAVHVPARLGILGAIQFRLRLKNGLKSSFGTSICMNFFFLLGNSVSNFQEWTEK